MNNSISRGLLVLTVMLTVFPAQAADYPAPGNFQTGAKAWSDNCGRCHNIRDARELRDDQWITTMFHMRVRAGLTGPETRDILTFLQGSNNRSRAVTTSLNPQQGSGEIRSGSAIYSQTCVACHGSDGRGSIPGAPDFTSTNSPLSKPDDTLARHISEGFQSPGSPMAMPARGGNPALTDNDVRAVLDHLRKQFGP